MSSRISSVVSGRRRRGSYRNSGRIHIGSDRIGLSMLRDWKMVLIANQLATHWLMIVRSSVWLAASELEAVRHSG